MRALLSIALCVCALVIGLATVAAGAGGVFLVACTYVESGVPGPEGNFLRVDDRTDSVISVSADGEEISIYNNTAGQVECSGGTPTVFNTDRIEISTRSAPFIDLLGPGATPEPGAAEIEVHVRETYRPEVLTVEGTRAADSIVAGSLGRRRVGVNVNAQADGASPDADVTLDVARPAAAEVKLKGERGDDRLSALGKAGFSGIFPADHLLLSGGPGDDRLIGGPHDDRFVGFTGNDVFLGGRGRDRFTIGPGRDLVKAGKGPDEIFNSSDVGGIPPDNGPDRIFGGAGNDHVEVGQDLAGDLVVCDGGRHDRVGIDPGDRTRGCEKVEAIRR